MNLRAVDLFQLGKTLATPLYRCAVSVEELEAERLQHSGAAVVGGTSADSHYKISASVIYGIQYQLTHSVGGGFHRISLIRRNERDSRRL